MPNENTLTNFEKYKEMDRSFSRIMETISNLLSLRKIQLSQMIMVTQALSNNVQSRTKTMTHRLIRLLEGMQEYKQEEEARINIEEDYKALLKAHLELKEELNEFLGPESIKEGAKLSAIVLEKYRQVI